MGQQVAQLHDRYDDDDDDDDVEELITYCISGIFSGSISHLIRYDDNQGGVEHAQRVLCTNG